MTSNKQAIDACFESQLYIQGKTLWLYKKELTAEDLDYLAAHRGIILAKNLTLLYFTTEPFAISGLRNGNWLNLSCLTITGRQSLRNEECSLLAQMKAPKLTHIKLQGNPIGPEGLLALTEAYWPNISKIRLEENKIGDQGCHYLAKSKRNFVSIRLSNKQLNQQIIRLENMELLYFYQNEFHIMSILGQYFMWLSKADWKSVSMIRFGKDLITWQGCRYLSNCSSVKLNDLIITKLSLFLFRVKNEDEGWFYLMKSNWKLKHFSMRGHQFENAKHIQQIYGKSFPKVKFYA